MMRWLVAAVWLCGGCAREAAPAEGGVRLVSTAPHLTEIVCAVGAAGALAGRTSACDYPPEVAGVPVTGAFAVPSLEALLAVRPTHVLESVLADPGAARQLEALGLAVVHVPCARLAEIAPAVRQVGALAGRAAEAERLAAGIEAGLAGARKPPAAARPRVLLLFAPERPVTAGREAFVAELLELAGGENVGGDMAKDYYHASMEWVAAQDPDLILCLFDLGGADPLARLREQVGWRSLRAVREGRVRAVADLAVVCRPGPRVLEGLAALEKVIVNNEA